MGKVIMSGIVPPLTAPVNGVPLGDLMEGTTIMIEENGVPIPFLLAKHDYESTLNGTGRILLVRKYFHSKRGYHSSQTGNEYSTSAIDTWLNSEYKAMLSPSVQELIGSTTFPYGSYNSSTRTIRAKTLSRSVFLLSVSEHGKSYKYVSVADGSVLPIASQFLTYFYEDGSNGAQWTRTPTKSTDYANYPYKSAYYAVYITAGGSCDGASRDLTTTHGIRPAFTIPSNMLGTVNDDGTVTLKV